MNQKVCWQSVDLKPDNRKEAHSINSGTIATSKANGVRQIKMVSAACTGTVTTATETILFLTPWRLYFLFDNVRITCPACDWSLHCTGNSRRHTPLGTVWWYPATAGTHQSLSTPCLLLCTKGVVWSVLNLVDEFGLWADRAHFLESINRAWTTWFRERTYNHNNQIRTISSERVKPIFLVHRETPSSCFTGGIDTGTN